MTREMPCWPNMRFLRANGGVSALGLHSSEIVAPKSAGSTRAPLPLLPLHIGDVAFDVLGGLRIGVAVFSAKADGASLVYPPP
jgi:hypothetical protein